VSFRPAWVVPDIPKTRRRLSREREAVDADQTRSRLLELLTERSFCKGKVILASGRESDFYIDCKQTSLSAEGHMLIGRLLYEQVRTRFEGVVGGPTLGADPLVSAVSTWSAIQGDPLDAFIIRKGAKGHGTGQPIEGLGNLCPSCPVALLEDVITTAGSTMRSVDRCREAGLDVRGVVCLVDRQEGGRQTIESNDLELVSLFTRADFPV
jgi:orotate phosphoribosyltransferase